jgi:hypothetical protein
LREIPCASGAANSCRLAAKFFAAGREFAGPGRESATAPYLAANVSYRPYLHRSFVDGANFDGTIDNVPELATPALRLCSRFFCASRHSGETTAVPGRFDRCHARALASRVDDKARAFIIFGYGVFFDRFESDVLLSSSGLSRRPRASDQPKWHKPGFSSTPRTCAVRQVGSYLGYSGRGANAFGRQPVTPTRLWRS